MTLRVLLSNPQKNPEYFGVINTKISQNVFFSAYSLKPNLINLILFDNIE